MDFNRPYGTVIGADNGCRYEQDGKQYNAAGELLSDDTEGGFSCECGFVGKTDAALKAHRTRKGCQ